MSEARRTEMMESSNGYNGGILVTDTTAITGVFSKLYVIAETSFTKLTTEYTKNDASTLAVGADWGTLAAGREINGKITAVTLAAGTVLLTK